MIEMKFVNEIEGFESKLGETFLKDLNSIFDKYKPNELVPQEAVKNMLSQVNRLDSLF